MRQIASQTGDLLRQMRFVAGRGAATESHREDVAGRGRCGGMERSGSLCGRGYRSAEAAAREMLQRKPLRQHREATASGSADAKGYREAAAGREAFPSREGTRQHREETPSREEAKMSMGSAQRESA